MSLPARQQAVLDQIERILAAADPQLKSMFAAFARVASPEAMPATEAIGERSPRRWTLLICLMVISLLSMVTIFVVATSRACQGLPSDQVVATATVRYAGCSKETDAWSKGGR